MLLGANATIIDTQLPFVYAMLRYSADISTARTHLVDPERTYMPQEWAKMRIWDARPKSSANQISNAKVSPVKS